jgi:hypothetical protein
VLPETRRDIFPACGPTGLETHRASVAAHRAADAVAGSTKNARRRAVAAKGVASMSIGSRPPRTLRWRHRLGDGEGSEGQGVRTPRTSMTFATMCGRAKLSHPNTKTRNLKTDQKAGNRQLGEPAKAGSSSGRGAGKRCRANERETRRGAGESDLSYSQDPRAGGGSPSQTARREQGPEGPG